MEESLVARRSRRSTAGNRMEAALAEMALDTTEKEADDDVDFISGKDEEDVFESDFESTDEEEAQGDAEAGERVVHEEEKRARKTNRSKLERATAAAHAKHKVTFNPEAQVSTPAPKSREVRRRVSLGGAVNAETGEELLEENSSPNRKKRHSQRKHTILNTSATVRRMKNSEAKKAATPKKMKFESKNYTQAELIARALDNEEGNIVEHRDYLQNEEEKRKRARVVRATVQGPLLRWVSRGEEIKVIVPPPTTSAYPIPQSMYPYGYFNPTSGSMPYGQNYTTTMATGTNFSTLNSTPTIGGSASTATPNATTSSIPQKPPAQPQFEPTNYISYSPQVNASVSGPPIPPLSQPPATALPPVERTEKIAKNYVVHELSQYESTPKASWNETMSAMFGDHVKWDELRVYSGRGRPLARPKVMCPITGKQAKYLDPRTGVPYADLRAYKVLTGILNHEYIWSPSTGCYVGKQEPVDNDTMETS
ncbi:YL1 nuclear protein-domain-containing protein [Collybia nuda]|uniref:YL1 nuclear protein-domain-containing protein n=1 Tax=Collybia nuda TaxID=64659 RepID=A0A9P5YDX3_9AGAR|nr:YL1 nuclear protein-domain-containing protein [Collybia nuda]